MADTTTASEARQWCDAMRKQLGLAIHRAKDDEECEKEEYEKEEYEKAWATTLPQITAVTDDRDLAVIGGSAVQSQLNKALGLARQKKWKEAGLALEIAYGNAEAGAEEHHPGQSCEQAHPKDKDHDAWRKARGEALMAQVKKDQFENIIFANEAYMSQGAIEHIVAGIQAKKADPKKAKQVIESLTSATVLQSVNEQMADFFKDMKHAGHEVAEAAKTGKAEARRATGEAFVHASKYLVRLLDGAQLLADKHKGLKFDLIDKVVNDSSVTTPEHLKGKVEEMLYALRKSAEIPADVKGEVGVAEVDALFGVNDIKDFRKVIFDFGADINAKVRSSETFVEEQSIDEKTEKQYFENVRNVR